MALRKSLQVQRLRALSTLLKGLHLTKNIKFDMGTFVDIAKLSEPETKISLDTKGHLKVITLKEGFCQTSACVLGYAALNPVFQRQGLGVNLGEYGGNVVYKNGNGRVFEGFQAGEKFFGMTNDEAEALFNGPWQTPKKAAKVIDGWLAGKYGIKHGDFYDLATDKAIRG